MDANDKMLADHQWMWNRFCKIMLWAVIGALSGRATRVYWRTTRPLAGGTDDVAMGPGETEQDVLAAYHGSVLLGFDLAAAAAAIAILAVMIWKPGA